MTSDANGVLVVPVWSDDGIVKPLVNDDGRVPVTIGDSTVTQDVNIESSDIDVPVSLDAATIDVPVSIEAATIDVPVEVDAASSSIQSQVYGWDLSNWRKLPMLWGFSSSVLISEDETSTGAGSLTVLAPVVSSGYVHVMTGFSWLHTVGANRDMILGVKSGASYYQCDVERDLPSSRWGGGPVHIIIDTGDALYATTVATAGAQTIYLQAVGYAMKVNE
jgi:hypothetical protein